MDVDHIAGGWREHFNDPKNKVHRLGMDDLFPAMEYPGFGMGHLSVERMKTIITLVLTVALVLLPVQSYTQTSPSPQDPSFGLVKCVAVLFVIGVGLIMLRAGCRACDKAVSNMNYTLTNSGADEMVYLPTILAGTNCFQPMTIQMAMGIGSTWVDQYRIDCVQNGALVTAVVSSNGVAVGTNSALVDTNGVTVIDFGRLATPASCRAGALFRLVQ